RGHVLRARAQLLVQPLRGHGVLHRALHRVRQAGLQRALPRGGGRSGRAQRRSEAWLLPGEDLRARPRLRGDPDVRRDARSGARHGAGRGARHRPSSQGERAGAARRGHASRLGRDDRDPSDGALDEFERKKVRNDYPLMALWEMGVRKLRVPSQDLEDPRIRERMQVLRTLGHRFTVYTLEVPRQRARDLLIEHHEVVDAWEVVCSWPEVERTVAAIQEVKAKAPLSTYLSKLRSKEDVQREGSRYYHFINHGFIVSEREAVEKLVRANGAASVIDGIVFRVVRQASPWSEIAGVADIVAALGIRATCHLRMTSTNPAEEFRDDLANANRVAEALLATLAVSGPGKVDVFVDTFADID